MEDHQQAERPKIIYNRSMQSVMIQHKTHLMDQICSHIYQYGPACDLNHLDVSQVTDLSFVELSFEEGGRNDEDQRSENVFFNYKFTGDVSRWNTANVTDMSNLFRDCTFSGDISGWNTSKVTNMDYGALLRRRSAEGRGHSNVRRCMFLGSSFSGSIGSWNLAALQSYDSVFDRFNDSTLGYLGVLQGKYELPDTFPRAAQFHQLRAIAESLDLDPLGAARFIYGGLNPSNVLGVPMTDTSFFQQHSVMS